MFIGGPVLWVFAESFVPFSLFGLVLGGVASGFEDRRLAPIERLLLTDPQASGGLLVACAPDTVTEVLSIFLQQGFPHVSVIGEVLEGQPGIAVA